MGSFAIRKVSPTGTRRGPAFVMRKGTGCNLEEVETPVYPPSDAGRSLRQTRVAASVSLREAGKLLGLLPEQLCGIEMGRNTFEEPCDFARAEHIINSFAAGMKSALPAEPGAGTTTKETR